MNGVIRDYIIPIEDIQTDRQNMHLYTRPQTHTNTHTQREREREMGRGRGRWGEGDMRTYLHASVLFDYSQRESCQRLVKQNLYLRLTKTSFVPSLHQLTR